jgi:hypothetical protein
VLLLCHSWCIGQDGYFLTPFFLRVDEVSTLIERLKSSTTREFRAFLARLVSAERPALDDSGSFYVHVIGSDGIAVELVNESTVPWKERNRFHVSSTWRDDAMNMVSGDFRNLRGREISFLASTTGWPEHTRMKVVTFLERIPVRDDQAAKPQPTSK